MRKYWAATAAAVLMAGGLAVAGPGVSPAAAAPPTPTRTIAPTVAAADDLDLYVDARRCPASGADGSEGAPFCTISAAVAVAQPGQTVRVEPGDYQETVRSPGRGTPAHRSRSRRRSATRAASSRWARTRTPRTSSRCRAVLDTRNGTGAPAHPLAAGGDFTLNLAGKVPSGATAVVLNVGVTQPTASGWLALYPYGQPLPGVSNLDFVSGQTVSNLVIVPVSGGQVSIHNGGVSGSVQVFADLEGYLGPQGTPEAVLDFVPSGPTRIADTRTGGGNPGLAGPVAAGGYDQFYASSDDYYCEGVCSRPAALVFNLTATAPTTSGFLTAYDADAANRPAASNLNFVANQTVSNAVMVTSTGSVKAYNSGPGTVQASPTKRGTSSIQRNEWVRQEELVGL